MKRFLLLCIYFCALMPMQLFSSDVSDSLLMDIKNRDNNKDRAILLNQLSKELSVNHLDSAIYYAKQGLAFAQEMEYSLGIAENAASLGDYYIITDSLANALYYYSISSQEFKELEKEFDYAQILMVIGNIYLSQNNYTEALSYYQNSELISEKNNYTAILPHVYNNTGVIYLDLDASSKALPYFLKAYDGFKLIDSQEDIANTVSNIGACYRADSNAEAAIEYYKESINIFKESNNLVGASLVLNELGNVEIENKNYSAALNYYKQAYILFHNQDTDYMGPKSRILVSILGSLGKVHSHLGNDVKAIDYLEDALKLAKENDYIAWIEISSYELSRIYEKKKDYAKALEYYKSYEQYGDSILNETSIKKITELEMQFQFDKKMKEIALEDAKKEAAQQRKEFLYILLIAFVVFIAIIAILLFVNQKNKTTKIELKRKNLKLEHENLQQELEHKNKELATNVMYLLKKNEFITNTAEKLSDAKLSFKKENQKVIQDVVRELLMNSSKDVWKEFEVRFQEVHSEFYNNLNEKYPELTPNEKKICAFLRLNMSTKDISAITYQSVRTINMARFRLRKKMGLETDENLVSILSKL